MVSQAWRDYDATMNDVTNFMIIDIIIGEAGKVVLYDITMNDIPERHQNVTSKY